MKKIIAIALLGFSTLGYSQVIIGDETGTSSDKSSVLLEFANTADRGIILPYVTSLPSVPTEGTIALDATTDTAAKVVYYNGSWQDLSLGETADVSTALSTQTSATEATNAKAIIGANTSPADGVLVLESTTKAMVLPHVSSIDGIVNPSPGMMVYVTNTKDKLLAVYNGSKWTFWAAKP